MAVWVKYCQSDNKAPSMMLEVVVSQDLWIWHAYFSVDGGNNDLNVIYQSPLLNDELLGKYKKCSFVLNEEKYKHGDFIVDEIYPSWETFVKTLPHPATDKKKRIVVAQEVTRNDRGTSFWHTKNPLRHYKTKCVIY